MSKHFDWWLVRNHKTGNIAPEKRPVGFHHMHDPNTIVDGPFYTKKEANIEFDKLKSKKNPKQIAKVCAECGTSKDIKWIDRHEAYLCPKHTRLWDAIDADNENPYPNEHSARLKRPSSYKRFRRENNRFGIGVHVIWGITSDGYAEVQAIRFDSSQFTAAQAKAWMKGKGYGLIKIEPAKKYKKNPAEDYLNVGEYVTVGKTMNLFFGATTSSPYTHYYIYRPGYLLRYQSTAPNGMVWFIDIKRNERGYTESGDTKNLLKDGRILRKYKKNPVSYLDVWNGIETPSKVELVRVIRELKGEELPDKDIIKSMHAAGIDKGFAEWIMTSFVWR